MADYRNLEVWKAGKALAVSAYKLSAALPPDERFGLRSQIQRSAVSIPANIAEGAGRGSDKEFGRFVRISIGSLNELDTLLQIAAELEQVILPTELTDQIRDLAVRLRNLDAKLSNSGN